MVVAIVTVRAVCRKKNGWATELHWNDAGNHQNTHCAITNPFTEQQEDKLRWYLEKYTALSPLETVKAETAAETINTYGQSLSRQIFRGKLLRWIQQLGPLASVHLSIEAPSHLVDFFGLHWEVLEDLSLWPVDDVCVSEIGIWRMVNADVMDPTFPSTSINKKVNILLVVSRPGGTTDIGHRTISRPLLEIIDTITESNQAITVEIVRPGSWEALENALNRYPPGYFDVVHFDMHGKVKTDENQIQRSYLCFVASQGSETSEYDARSVGQLLNNHKVPLVILNACESAKEGTNSDVNFARTLVSFGIPFVVAMSYEITLSAAVIFVQRLYQSYLLDKLSLFASVLSARQELITHQERTARFGLVVKLKDSFVPVVYHREIPVSEMKHMIESFGSQCSPIKDTKVPSQIELLGRDAEILEIERCLLERPTENILLLQGMKGVGKTSLLKFLSWWWEKTRLISAAFYFDYQQRLHTVEDIDVAIRNLNTEGRNEGNSMKRKLLILDNLETAVHNPDSTSFYKSLTRFLRRIKGKDYLVILASSRYEHWARAAFRSNIYPLTGLNASAAFELARKLMQPENVELGTDITDIEELDKLLDFLSYSPQAMKTILPLLSSQSPGDLFLALQFPGNTGLGQQSVVTSASHQVSAIFETVLERLDQNEKDLLLCLTPFSSVLPMDIEDWVVALLDENQCGSKYDFILTKHLVNRGLLSQICLLPEKNEPTGYPKPIDLQDCFPGLQNFDVICSIFDSLVEKLADEGIVQELVLQPSQTVSYEIHPLLPIYLSKRLSSFDERPEVLYAIERGFVYYHYDRATESPTHILASIDHVKSYRLHKRELNSVLNAMWISWFELRPNSKSHYSEIRKRLGGKSGREKRFEENLCNIFKSAMNSENTVRDDTDKIENTHLRAVKGRITFVTQSLLWAMWSGVRTTDIELFAEVMLSKLLPLLSLSPEEFWNYNEYYFISFMATVFVAEMKRRHGELQVWRDWCRIILKIVVSSADYDVEILDGPNLLSIVGMAYVAIDETDEGEEVFEAIVKDGTASLEILLSSMYLLVAIAHRQGKRDVMAQRLQKLQQLMETSTAKHANATFILTVIQRMPFIPITGAISTSLSQDIRDAIFKKFDTVAPIVDAMKLKHQGKKEKAYELVYDALGAAVERKSLFRQITCYDTLCAMHYEDEDWEQATALAAKAQRLVEADPNSGSFEKPGGLRYFVQGHCHERLRDWDMAELNYQKTVERCLNAGEHALFAKAAVGLMTTKLSRGERID